MNYSEKENTWEPIENLNCAELVEEFERNHEKPEKSKGKEKSKEKQSREKDDRSEEMEEKSANESEAMETVGYCSVICLIYVFVVKHSFVSI